LPIADCRLKELIMKSTGIDCMRLSIGNRQSAMLVNPHQRL